MIDEDTEDRESTGESTLWKPGQSGNPKGRPKGARAKLGEQFILDLYKDWQAAGLVTLQSLREAKPEVYVKVIADLLPKQLDVKGAIEHEHTHRSVSATHAWLEGIVGERAASPPEESLPH